MKKNIIERIRKEINTIYWAYILRHNELSKHIFEGKMLGKRTRRRPTRTFMEGVVGRLKFNIYQEMKSTAGDWGKWLKRQGERL